MIDLKNAEWEDKMKVILKDGTSKICKGNGVSLAEDFEDEREQYDTLFIIEGSRGIALNIEEIEKIEIYE